MVIKIILPLLFATLSQAGFKTLNERCRYDNNCQAPARRIVRKSSNILSEIKKNDAEIKKLLKIKTSVPLFVSQSLRMRTGDVIRGTLLNSIVSTNLASPLVVRIDPAQGFPTGTKLACKGQTSSRRVLTYCSVLIVGWKEHVVKVQVLNTDGSSGLKGELYTGKEEHIAGIVASEFTKGLLQGAQEKISNPLGSHLANTRKNQFLQGGVNSLESVTSIMEDEMNSRTPKIFINAGKKVLVYFERPFIPQIEEQKRGLR